MSFYRPCPADGCGLDAEVLDEWVWMSTDGPVEHWEQRCPSGHYYCGLTARYHRGESHA